MNQSKIIILPSRTEVFNQAILEGWYYWCIPISTNVWSAINCIPVENNIINWNNDSEIIIHFLKRIIYELKNYKQNTWEKMHEFYKKYSQWINIKKKIIFLQSYINEIKSK